MLKKIIRIILSSPSLLFVLSVFLIMGGLSKLLGPKMRESKGRVHCSLNLRSFGPTFDAYREARGHLPPVAITDPNGKPLLSWRVTILPWMKYYDREGNVVNGGHDSLYKMFRLDEPWDSPHNKALIKHMPMIYYCPSEERPREDGFTNYRVLVGPGTMFEGLEGLDISKNMDFLGNRLPETYATAVDGLGNTLVVTESSESTPWTKPDELEFVPGHPLPPLGSKHPGYFIACFANGSVRAISNSTRPEQLKAMITRNGHEVMGP